MIGSELDSGKEFLLTELYRPKTIDDCILPDRIKKVFLDYVKKKKIPHLLLVGPPGVGKTTAAKAMCEQIGVNYLFINSSDERGIDTFRVKIKNFASTLSFDNRPKVVILDEADGLTPEAQDALKNLFENFSKNCTFIMTCNFKAKIIEALHSRCVTFDFTLQSAERPKMAAQFFKRLTEMLQKEGAKYDDASLAKVVEKYFPDYRRTINELSRFIAVGSIDAGVVAQIAFVKSFPELLGYIKSKDWNAMRKWAVMNSDIDPAKIFRKIYDCSFDSFKSESIPQLVVILARYQEKAAFAADQEINLVACLTEIMIDCEIK